jgi:hypothetical protein
MAYTRSKAQAGRGTIFAIGPISGTTVPTGVTGTTVAASATITAIAATAGIVAGLSVSGAGIPVGATVVSVVLNTSVTISAPATASASAVALTFAVAYTAVGEIKTTDPGKGQFDKEETSNFQSGLDKEYLKTMRDNGAPKLSGNRVGSDAGQLAVVAAYNDGDNSYMIQITLPINKKAGQTTTGDIYTYDALVMHQSFGPVEVNKAIPFECELQITGPFTFVAGS